MNIGVIRKCTACLLGLAIFLSGIPLGVRATDDPLPAETIPLETVLPETLPVETVPAGSSPAEPAPEESIPPETVPGESIPVESEPEEMKPTETEPAETIPEETVPEETLPEETAAFDSMAALLPEPEALPGPGLYFGLLHAHTDLSEGTATPEDTFLSARNTPQMDFFAVTDLSSSFDHRELGSIGTDGSAVSADWAAGKAAAEAAATRDFAAFFGYEMNWPAQMKIGHLSTFGSPGFQSWDQEPYRNYNGALEAYYHALASVPGAVSQFNHPGTQYGNFDSFHSWSEAADRAVTLLEVDFGEKQPFRYYIQALDLGWHLAPTAGQSIFSSSWQDNGCRTVVYAQSLTEAGILDALKNCRAYATQDADLEILYTMDGHWMGSRLDRRNLGETADLSVSLCDRTDAAIGLVEVITGGGAVAAQQTLSAPSGTLTFSLPPESGYYFLRITQPDGHQAVTAPIWVDGEEDLGILDLTCTTDVPVQNEPVCLTLELHNGESADFLVDALDLLADGVLLLQADTLTHIPARTTLSHPLVFSGDFAGLTDITLRLSGTLEGSPRCFETSIALQFRQSSQVTGIAVDASHGNPDLNHLMLLNSLAAEEHIRMAAYTEPFAASDLKNCRFLLIPAPSRPFSTEFLSAIREYADYGGSIILCGQAVSEDSGLQSAGELNRLLKAIDSSIQINSDLARDPANNSGDPSHLNSHRINTDLAWCQGVSPDQVYRSAPGCTIDPGSGTWMVKGRDTTSAAGTAPGAVTLMACEPLSGGGTVFAAGCLFLSDDYLAEPKNIWDEPYANQTIARNLLGIGGDPIPLSTIAQARSGNKNQLFRVRGYVTAGTSNPYNTFPDTLYLQDDTGGIAVTPFPGESIQQGTPVEITGYAGTSRGNRILKVSSWKVLDGSLYQYLPLTGSWDTLLEPGVNGGRLVQIEGKCQEIYCREDDTLAGCLLEDDAGNTAVIRIEDVIGNGSDGENTLHKTIRKSRKVRAMGLLHIDEYGDPVLRVRNCEEVVWVPPRHFWIPKTGDFLLPAACLSMTLSLTGLLILGKRKRP